MHTRRTSTLSTLQCFRMFQAFFALWFVMTLATCAPVDAELEAPADVGVDSAQP